MPALPGLYCEVRLRGVQLLRSNTESLLLQDDEEVSEVAKFGPIVHSSLLCEERAFDAMGGAEQVLFRAAPYGNPDS